MSYRPEVEKIFKSKLNAIFDHSLTNLYHEIWDRISGSIKRLEDLEIQEFLEHFVEPLKDQELWDHLVYSLNTLGTLSTSDLREVCQLRRQWLEINEVWDQIIPENSPEQIFKLGMSVLQNCPQERAWVKLLYVLQECCE